MYCLLGLKMGKFKRHHRMGLTILEMMMVVLLIGVLVAIAVPRFLDTSATATDNSLKHTLGVVRDAIERYANDHKGTLPGTVKDVSIFAVELAPYLRGGMPACPIPPCTNSQVIFDRKTPLQGNASSGQGWRYNPVTGEFICNNGFRTKSNPGIRYDEF